MKPSINPRCPYCGVRHKATKSERCAELAEQEQATAVPAPTEQDAGQCHSCGASDAECLDSDGGCCDGCRSTGGCSHGYPAPTDNQRDDGLAARMAQAIYDGGQERWLPTVDGSANSAAYEYARRALRAVVDGPTTPGGGS